MKNLVVIALLTLLTSCKTDQSIKLTPKTVVERHCGSCGGVEKVVEDGDGISAKCKHGSIHAFYDEDNLVIIGSCKK